MLKNYPWIKTRRDHIWRYWMADPSDRQPWLEMDFGKPKVFNKVSILEKYDRIKAYKLSFLKDGKWVVFHEGRALGSLSLALPEAIRAQKIRIEILDWSSDYPNEGPGLREFDFWFDERSPARTGPTRAKDRRN
jgi:hypothetical protein